MAIIKQEASIPFTGIVFIVSLVIVLISHFAQVDFGVIGLLAWIVVIVGVAYFVLWVIAQLVR